MPEKDQIKVGDQFGALVVDRFELKEKNLTLVAKCACGKEKVFWKKSAILRQKSCGCGVDNNNLTAKQRRSWNFRLQGYKSGAKKRNFDWNLTLGDFVEIASKPCYYCELPAKRWECFSNAPSVRKDSPDAVSEEYVIYISGIDRYDSNLGYTKDNCVPCCMYCNRAKSDMSFSDFKDHIERLAKCLLQKPKKQN